MWLLEKTTIDGEVLYVGSASTKYKILWVQAPFLAMKFPTKEAAQDSWLCGWYFGTTPCEAPGVQPTRVMQESRPNPFAGVLNA